MTVQRAQLPSFDTAFSPGQVVAGKSPPGRRWFGLVPDAFELIGDLMPEPLATILKRVDSISPGPQEDEVVWDDSAGRVSPSFRIWEAQRHLVGDPTPGFRLIPDLREGGFVDAERVHESALAKKPEAPGSPTSGPNESDAFVCRTRAHFWLLRRIRFFSPSAKSSPKRVSTAAM